MYRTRSSAIADNPRDASLQTAGGCSSKSTAFCNP